MTRAKAPGAATSVFFGGWLCLTGGAMAQGSGENVVLIVDPLNAESMYVANYYREARDVPPSNVLYFSPASNGYEAFVDWNLAALRALVADRGIESQADVVLVMPGAPFYIDAPDSITDQCSPVRRLSISGAYTTAFIADEVLGGVSSNLNNRYAQGTQSMERFDSEETYYNGAPSNDDLARRYYLGALLGYTGERGNTLEEILDNIDRSVAADYTRPPGTFYFCETGDDARSAPRHNSYPGTVSAIIDRGGAASHEFRQMPRNEFDIQSILTGAAVLDIQGANMGILPGAYADHLTSFGAMFDNDSQTKISEWIRKGASASHGAVEEPCNYAGKFTNARSMVYYYDGASMGEAIFRALAFVPFQGLIYGDPMCRPHDYPVSVSVPDAPTEPFGGTIELNPTGSTDKPTGFVLGYDVVIDNRLADEQFFPPLTVDSTEFADGWHEMRVFGYDTSLVRSRGTWRHEIVIDNMGRSAEIEPVSPTGGDLSTTFSFDLSVTPGAGGAPVEVRLVHHGRVVASMPGCGGEVRVTGLQLGAGVSDLQAEALFADGMRVRSAPTSVAIDYLSGTPGGQAPATWSSTAWVGAAEEFLVDLPFVFDDAGETPTFEIVDGPAQAQVVAGPDGPVRLVRPDPGASGYDVLSYRVSSSAGQSEIGRVVLVYDQHPFDVNADGAFDLADVVAIRSNPVDINFDGVADASDVRELALLARCGLLRTILPRP